VHGIAVVGVEQSSWAGLHLALPANVSGAHNACLPVCLLVLPCPALQFQPSETLDVASFPFASRWILRLAPAAAASHHTLCALCARTLTPALHCRR
jgi:hypothetical protein